MFLHTVTSQNVTQSGSGAFLASVRCSGGVHAYARCGKVLKLSLLEATSRGICGWGSSNLVGVGAWFDSVVATCMGRRGAEEIGRWCSPK